MNKEQRVRLGRFHRVQQFADRYQSQFPEGSPAAVAVGKLARAVEAIKGEASARVARTRAGREQKPSARAALVHRLDAIARTARVIGRGNPGFAEPFALPRPKRDDVIVATAAAFIRDAQPLAARFTENGLPAAFLEDLRRSQAAFEQALALKADGRVASASAQAAIREAETLGNAAIEALDVIVRYQFAADAAMQAGWTNARRLDRVPHDPTDEAAPETTPTTPPATVTPVTPKQTDSEGVARKEGGTTTAVKPAA